MFQCPHLVTRSSEQHLNRTVGICFNWKSVILLLEIPGTNSSVCTLMNMGSMLAECQEISPRNLVQL